jgi:hypothetical protein
MKIRFTGFGLMPILFTLVAACLPASTAAQTVVGPEYTLNKTEVSSLQRDERRCDYFLWTKLGGDAQRISFSYVRPDGKADSDAPRLQNVTIVINSSSKTTEGHCGNWKWRRRTMNRTGDA